MSGWRNVVRLSGGAVIAAALLAGTVACGPSNSTAAGPAAPTTPAGEIGPAPAPATNPAPGNGSQSGGTQSGGTQGGGTQGGGSGGGSQGGGNSGGDPGWPSPEDCITYNPDNLTVTFQAGFYQVTSGNIEVIQVPDQFGGDTGQKALALAQRYHRHCFIGRGNTRPDQPTYVFDYWRDASGRTPTIADQDQDCSTYNPHNLTVEDMGDGDGWRVKDHDHVLQLFDNGTDARNGKLVLARYSTICFIGVPDGDSQDLISYLM
jgi:hypothetical protein